MSMEEYDPKKVVLFVVIVFIIVASLAGIGSGIYFYSKYQSAQKQLRQASLNTAPQEDVKSLVDKINKLIKLPEGETPTVATVSNLDRLKDQPFFANAKVGDQVLIYTLAKKAILYDPFDNRVVEVGPLIIPTESLAQANSNSQVLATASAQSEIITTPKVLVNTTGDKSTETPSKIPIASTKLVIYNGTAKIGLTNSIASAIKTKLPTVSLIDKTYAVKNDYARTIIVDLSGKKSEDLQKIAQLAGAELSALPSAEKKPAGADILLIVGADKVK